MPTINPTLPDDGEDIDAADVNTPFQAILSVLNGNIDEDNIKNGAVLLNKLATAVQQSLLPVGTFLSYGGTSAPSGYLLCDGSAVSRSTYSSLYAVLGTAYGVGDGSTTFNLPDFRGRVPVGNDAMGGSAANVLQRSTTLTTTSGSASATVASATGLSQGMYIQSANVPSGTTISSISGTTITMSANATATASGTAARFSMVLDAQALGSAGGADVITLVTNQIPAHNHSVPSFTAGAGGGGAPLSSSNSGTQSLPTTNNTGGGQAHSNVQPSQVTNYIVKV